MVCSLNKIVFVSMLLLSVLFAQQPQQGLIVKPNYSPALAGYKYIFPRDHGSHPKYKLEWWYYTGHLKGNEGKRFGYELTFFRQGMDRHSTSASRWSVNDLHIAHFALSEIDMGRFHFYERLNRQGPGIAWARQETLDIGNSGWTARLDDNEINIRAYANGILLELKLSPTKAPVIHGIDGISQKADGIGKAAHYYSLTRMTTQGLLSFNGKPIEVSGESWMDHEFGTNQLGPKQIGWDWFGLQLDNGEELMLYQLRNEDGSIDHNSSGTIIAADGKTQHLSLEEFNVKALSTWKSPKSKAIYPIDWELNIPAMDSHLRIIPLMEEQELVTTRSTGIAYWEGAVRIEGKWKGKSILGKGYVELTGYSDRYRPNV